MTKDSPKEYKFEPQIWMQNVTKSAATRKAIKKRETWDHDIIKIFFLKDRIKIKENFKAVSLTTISDHLLTAITFLETGT